MKLTKGMFGSEFDLSREDIKIAREIFGLSCGQMRGHDIIHNGGWYNQEGEKLGWGDLCLLDLLQISKRLQYGHRGEPHQWFIVLHENDSFWHFRDDASEIQAFGWLQHMKPDMHAPGIRYVVSKAAYAIAPNAIFCMGDVSNPAKMRQVEENEGLYQLLLRMPVKPKAWLWAQMKLPPQEFCTEHDGPKGMCLRYHLTVHNGDK